MSQLTEQERQEILSRRQSQQSAPGTLPAEIAQVARPYPKSFNSGTSSLSYEYSKPQAVLDQELGQKIKEKKADVMYAAPSDSQESAESTQENYAKLLQRLEEKFNLAQSVERGPMAVVSGGARLTSGKLQLDPDAATYQGLREATLGQSARVVSTERGVMTNQDLTRIKAAIPNLMTSRETAKKQFKELQGITTDVVTTSINRGRRKRGEPEITTNEVSSKLGFSSFEEDPYVKEARKRGLIK